MKRTNSAVARAPQSPPDLAVVSDNYLSAEQLAHFRSLLIERRDTLLVAADVAQTHMRDDDNTASDPSDRASLEEDHNMARLVSDHEHEQLQRIDAAINRIDEGRYGWCMETGEPIGESRLLAEPTALYCLDVQEQHELRRRQGR